jgi:transcriptional regulator with XRE-family HTH domain
MATIGQKIRQLATDNELSLRELAERSGIPYRSMQNYVSDNQQPGADALSKLRACLEVDLNWLLSAGDSSGRLTDAETGEHCEIDGDLKEEVLELLRIHLPQYFSSPTSNVAVQAFSDTYNQVCHLPEGQSRSVSIRKAIGLIRLGSQESFLRNLDQIPEKELSEEQRTTLKASAQRGMDKIRSDYDLTDREDGAGAQQNFHGDVGQVGGGDINNNFGDKDK